MDDLGFGLGVTVIGLGIVFGLLAILWLLLAIALRLDRRSARGGGEQEPNPAAAARLTGDSVSLEPDLVAAISVAVLRHTDALRRQAAPAMRSHTPGSLLFASRWVDAGRMRQGQPWRRRGR